MDSEDKERKRGRGETRPKVRRVKDDPLLRERRLRHERETEAHKDAPTPARPPAPRWRGRFKPGAKKSRPKTPHRAPSRQIEVGAPLPSPKLLLTVGLGRRQPQRLIEILVERGVKLVADVRADAAVVRPGFAKDRDLAFLLKELAGIDYRTEEELVPPRELREQFRRDKNWHRFEQAYTQLLAARRVEEVLDRELYAAARACLLGGDAEPEHDWRRLAAEYLAARWSIGSLQHL